MDFTQELIIALIGLLGVAAITISIVIKNNKKVTKTNIKQKGNNPQAYVNSTVNNSKKDGK